MSAAGQPHILVPVFSQFLLCDQATSAIYKNAQKTNRYDFNFLAKELEVAPQKKER